MNALEYYLSEQSDPSLLPLTEVPLLDFARLSGKLVGRPGKNSVVIEGAHSLIWAGARRISSNGLWLELVSLHGGLRICASSLNLTLPVELFLINQEEAFKCQYSFSKDWQGYERDGQINMQAVRDLKGKRHPIFNITSFRGERTKKKKCFLWLPAVPKKIQYDADGATLLVLSDEYWVPKQVSVAIQEGWVQWVLPNDKGWFEVLIDG